jgi:ribonuclease-3
MLNNSNLIDRIRLPFRKEKELFSAIYEITGFYPRNIEFFKLALMHRSVSKRNAKGRPLNNERLEFLGDAILDAVVGDIVYRHFDGKREGFLTNTRSKLVQRETLGRLAQEMGLIQLIKSSDHSTSHNSYMGGNAFEALVGAIYLDRGYQACMKFMKKRILKQLINIDKVAYKEVNFKSKLLEWTQKNRVRMEYRQVSQSKDNSGSPVFECVVIIEGIEGCKGKGYSKKESQQMASKDTLQRLRREPQFIDAIFAAKTERTKMEEEPVQTVPDVEGQEDFIIAPQDQAQAPLSCSPMEGSPEVQRVSPNGGKMEGADEEFSLDDITAIPVEKTREEIIAEAEAAAFAEEEEA